jgi:putative Holliday junction resolvase
MRALGIDYGKRRIGLALSDPSGTLARPWRTLARTGSDDRLAGDLAAEIAALAAEEDGLSAVVVGLPRRLDGTPNDLTPRVEAFAARLRALAPVPVVLQDERLTSAEAESRLAIRERDWRKRKARIDAAAAAVILQDYLDQPAPPAVEAPEAGA